MENRGKAEAEAKAKSLPLPPLPPEWGYLSEVIILVAKARSFFDAIPPAKAEGN